MTGRREFEVDRDVTMSDALQLIRAALADEGLALGPRAGAHDAVTSVIVDGRKVFMVPLSRVLTQEDDAAARALLAAQVEVAP